MKFRPSSLRNVVSELVLRQHGRSCASPSRTGFMRYPAIYNPFEASEPSVYGLRPAASAHTARGSSHPSHPSNRWMSLHHLLVTPISMPLLPAPPALLPAAAVGETSVTFLRDNGIQIQSKPVRWFTGGSYSTMIADLFKTSYVVDKPYRAAGGGANLLCSACGQPARKKRRLPNSTQRGIPLISGPLCTLGCLRLRRNCGAAAASCAL
jgi:hypothetical protein